MRDIKGIFEIVRYEYKAHGCPFKKERKERKTWDILENLGKIGKIKRKSYEIVRDKPLKH